MLWTKAAVLAAYCIESKTATLPLLDCFLCMPCTTFMLQPVAQTKPKIALAGWSVNRWVGGLEGGLAGWLGRQAVSRGH